jgi:hypothetical protein
MGSTNAILNYSQKDIYTEWDIIKGKYDNEITEIDLSWDTIDGIKLIKTKVIIPNRPFCYMVGFSAIEGSIKSCLAEFKHILYEGKLIQNKYSTWDIINIPINPIAQKYLQRL